MHTPCSVARPTSSSHIGWCRRTSSTAPSPSSRAITTLGGADARKAVEMAMLSSAPYGWNPHPSKNDSAAVERQSTRGHTPLPWASGHHDEQNDPGDAVVPEPPDVHDRGRVTVAEDHRSVTAAAR